MLIPPPLVLCCKISMKTTAVYVGGFSGKTVFININMILGENLLIF